MPSWRGRAWCTAPRRARAARSDVRIEVAYALAQGAIQRTYDLPEGATVGDALRAAGADPAFAAIDVEGSPIGVFGALVVSGVWAPFDSPEEPVEGAEGEVCTHTGKSERISSGAQHEDIAHKTTK